MSQSMQSDFTGVPFEKGALRRRDVINIAAVSFGGVGVAIATLPIIDSMNPSADILAVSTTEVDISAIELGTAIVAVYLSQPLFVRRLSAVEIAEANAVPLSILRDPQTLAQRTKAGHAEWLVTMGVCTHLGCIPLGARQGENRAEYGGYFCPCHGSVYDTAARIRKGPAPRNLDVPEYVFSSPTTLLVGKQS
jgi:ubiquinol-cytochrome c reductase iron-sulfur subunit